ncbi:hypothetical protein [Corynebacterium sp.]|uniref:hypothetical protein n=1 Tax=Corynebacterium sp. TaxID=1720 RepID=UPI001991E19B|nr:hypothetical protein [Corynebacterium sp.]HHU67576.1 hypothetical protein [Corynebacterium sp.]
MNRIRWSPLWAGLLIVALLWPLALPGQLALRDMLVLDSPALSAGALGTGDLPARNAPQDGVLAVAGIWLPASWVARLMILGGAVAGAWGAVLLARTRRAGPVATLAALTLTLWNPAVVERLLQGHWSLVIAAWLLPLIAAAGLTGRTHLQWGALWAASLTPTGGLFALLTALATARGRRLPTALIGLLCCLPWLLPGLLLSGGATGAASVAAFAPRSEGWPGGQAGTVISVLGLGGIWNADAVPLSRTLGFALVGVVLSALLLTRVRHVPGPLLVLAGLGLGGALLPVLLPDLWTTALTTVPGAGLLRDASKLTLLAVPAWVAAAASVNRWAGVILALALLQVPDAPRALAPLTPQEITVDESLVERAAGRDVLLADATPLTLRPDGTVIVEPLTKALPTVESGALTVDGVLVDPPAPRWSAAMDAWGSQDLGRLAELGVGLVLDDGQVTEIPGVEPRSRVLGLSLLAVWSAVPLLVAVLRLRRGRAAAPRNARP